MRNVIRTLLSNATVCMLRGIGSITLICLLITAAFCGETRAQSIAAGVWHSVLLKDDGTVWACGNNDYGQLGDGTTTPHSTFQQISGLTDVIAISTRGYHNLFLKSDSTVWACGLNNRGQIGDGTNTDRLSPVQVPGLTGIIKIATGSAHSFFLKKDGTVLVCGYNFQGQLGDGTTTARSVPQPVPGLTNIIDMSGGQFHSLFLKSDGTAWACGDNSQDGELGDGSGSRQLSPVQVSGLTNITSVQAGYFYSLFLKNDGTAWVCGSNSSGQHGTGNTTGHPVPVQVGLTGIATIIAGGEHAMFLKSNNTVWACGRNAEGQLGDGTTTNRLSPVQINTPSGVTAISSRWHSIFVKDGCTIWTCGDNGDGELGDGSTTSRATAAQVSSLCPPITVWYSKATGNLNSLSTWGSNTDGTGTAPTDFTTAGQTFNIRNNSTPTIGATWSPVGTINVGDGVSACNFTIPTGFQYTGDAINVAANATLTITNATTPTLGTLNAASTVVYNNTGAQALTGTVYGNLSLSGGGTKTAGANLSVSATLSIAGGVTMNMAGNTLSGTLSTISNSGKIQTQATTSALPTGKTWNGTIEYSGSTSQTVIAGTYNNLTINNNAGTLLGGGVAVSGVLSFTAGKLSLGSNTLTFGSAATVSGMTRNSVTGRNITGSTTSQITCNNTGALGTLVMDETSAATQTLKTLAKNGAGITLGSPVTLGDGTVSTALSMSVSSTLDNGGFAITCKGSIVGAGQIIGSGIVTMATGGTSIADIAIPNLTINVGSGNSISIAADYTLNISGELKFTSGKLSLGSGTLLFAGTGATVSGMTRNSGTGCNITGSASASILCMNLAALGTLVMDESNLIAQSLEHLGLFGGDVTLGSPFNVNALTLTSGKLILGNYDILLFNTPWGSASSYVVATGTGMLRRSFSGNGSLEYPVGDAANYTPVTLNITGSAYSSADVGVSMSASKPGANTNTNNYLNRYWNVRPIGITAPAAAVTSATYVAPGDITGNESAIISGAYTGASPWVKFTSVSTTAHTFSTTSTPLTAGAATIFTGIMGVDVSNFTSTTASSPCRGAASTVIINSTTLISGRTYTANYTLSGASGNGGTHTSASFTYGTNTGSFIIDAAKLPNTGATTILINYVTDVADAVQSRTPSANNAASFTVRTVPVITPGSNSPVCSGDTLKLTNTVSSGSGPYNYSWAGPGTFSSSTKDTFIAAATGSATGTYTAIVTDVNGCKDTGTVSAVVNAAAGTILAPVSATCEGSTVALSNATASGAWSSSNVSNAPVSAGGVVSAVHNGVYEIRYTMAGGCYTTFSLTVNSKPILDAAGIDPICANNTLELTSSASAGTTPYSYSWAGPNSFSDDDANTSIASATTAATGTYTVMVIDDNSCSDTATVDATVYPTPVVTAGNNAPVCEEKVLTLSGTVTGGTASYSYVWSGPNGFTASEEDPTVTSSATVAADGVYQLILTDANNCADTATTSVTIYPIQPIVGSDTVTFGLTTTLTDPVPGGTWSTPTPWVTKVNAGTGVVKGISASVSLISYTTTHGCVATHMVTVLSGVNACVGQSIAISDGLAAGGTWSSGSASIATVNSAGVVTGVSAGNVVITHRLSTSVVANTTVKVNPLAATTAASTSLCQGQSLVMTNGTAGGGTWYSGNTSIAMVSSSGVVTGIAGGLGVIHFTPVAGCLTTKIITINPSPVITGATSVCAGLSATLSNSINGGAWSSSSGSMATVNAAGIVYGVAAGAVRISYMLTSGCYGTNTLTVNPISAITGGSGNLCQGSSMTLANATPGGGAWTSSNTIVATAGSTGVVTGEAGGAATISFTTVAGCVATKAVSVFGITGLAGTTAVCVGQTVSLSSSLGGGTWSSSSGALATVSPAGVVSGVGAGTPRVSYIWPNGCHAVIPVTVKALSPITGGSPGMCQSGSMTLANATPYGGAWSSSNTAAATVSASGFVKGTGVGNAVISFTTTVGGCVATRTVVVNACRESNTTETSMSVADADDLRLFPNPNRGMFSLKGSFVNASDDVVSIEVVNMLEQVIYRSSAQVQSGNLDTRIVLQDNLANGMYMLNLRWGNSSKTFRFVIE